MQPILALRPRWVTNLQENQRYILFLFIRFPFNDVLMGSNFIPFNGKIIKKVQLYSQHHKVPWRE